MTRLDPLNFFFIESLILDQTDLLKINSLTILKSKLKIMKHEIGSFYDCEWVILVSSKT